MAFNEKKYRYEFLIAVAVYSAVLVASRFVAKFFDVGGVALVFLSLTPIVPAVGATMVYMRHYRTMDELQRRIQVEAFAAAALLVCLVTFTFGFAEGTALPQPTLIWVLPATLFAWGVIACFLRYRYAR